LTYQDVNKLAQVNLFMGQMFVKAKVAKKVIRFGNLNRNLRAKFWKQISEQEKTVEQVK